MVSRTSLPVATSDNQPIVHVSIAPLSYFPRPVDAALPATSPNRVLPVNLRASTLGVHLPRPPVQGVYVKRKNNSGQFDAG